MKKPNFLYVGAAKSGSTWLYNALRRHPQVFVPESKELFFFDRYYERGASWYFDKFSTAPETAKALGEISHDYMYHPLGAERIKNVLGENVKIIFFLRNPVDKAFSGYLFKVRNGFTTASFEDDLRQSTKPLERVRYDVFVETFLKVFNKTKIGVFFFEDLVADPNKLARDVFRFLEIDGLDGKDFSEKVLPASKSRSRLVSNLAKRTALLMRSAGLEGVVSKVKQTPLVNKTLYKPYGAGEKPTMKTETRKDCMEKVRASVLRLNELIEPDVSEKWPEYFI